MTTPDSSGEGDETHRRFEYFRNMPLADIVKHLGELSLTFRFIEAGYTDSAVNVRRELSPEHKEALGEAIGDLLPMGMNEEVQVQLKTADPEADLSGLPFYQIGELTNDIMLFMANFGNTGITAHPGSPFD